MSELFYISMEVQNEGNGDKSSSGFVWDSPNGRKAHLNYVVIALRNFRQLSSPNRKSNFDPLPKAAHQNRFYLRQ
jgi:hypothetical protein